MFFLPFATPVATAPMPIPAPVAPLPVPTFTGAAHAVVAKTGAAPTLTSAKANTAASTAIPAKAGVAKTVQAPDTGAAAAAAKIQALPVKVKVQILKQAGIPIPSRETLLSIQDPTMLYWLTMGGLGQSNG